MKEHAPGFDTETWRIFRIMSEFVEGFETMSRVGRAVSVFGSSRTPRSDPWYQKARQLGRTLAERRFAVITGGGPGMMEAANRGAHDGGGISVGLNITLPHEQRANPWANVRLDFRYFFARLVMFVKYANAFICLPGGFGTLHEFYNSMTLIQTAKADPFPVILIGRSYWRGLMSWMRKQLQSGPYPMIDPQDMELFTLTDSIKEAVAIVEHAGEGREVEPPEREPSHAQTLEGTLVGEPPQAYKPRSNRRRKNNS